MERERVRQREPVQLEEGAHYEETLRQYSTARAHAKTGKTVIRAKELPWRQRLTKNDFGVTDREPFRVKNNHKNGLDSRMGVNVDET